MKFEFWIKMHSFKIFKLPWQNVDRFVQPNMLPISFRPHYYYIFLPAEQMYHPSCPSVYMDNIQGRGNVQRIDDILMWHKR